MKASSFHPRSIKQEGTEAVSALPYGVFKAEKSASARHTRCKSTGFPGPSIPTEPSAAIGSGARHTSPDTSTRTVECDYQLTTNNINVVTTTQQLRPSLNSSNSNRAASMIGGLSQSGVPCDSRETVNHSSSSSSSSASPYIPSDLHMTSISVCLANNNLDDRAISQRVIPHIEYSISRIPCPFHNLAAAKARSFARGTRMKGRNAKGAVDVPLADDGSASSVGQTCSRVFLVNLDLSENQISDKGIECLMDWLIARNHYIVLRVLKLYKNLISDGGTKAICRLIEHQAWPFEEIHLSHNFINDISARLFFESFLYASASGRLGYVPSNHQCSNSSDQPSQASPSEPGPMKSESNSHLMGRRKPPARPLYPRYDPLKRMFLPVWLRLEYNRITETGSLLNHISELLSSFREEYVGALRRAGSTDDSHDMASHTSPWPAVNTAHIACYAERHTSSAIKDPSCSPKRCARASAVGSPLFHLYSFHHQGAGRTSSIMHDPIRLSSSTRNNSASLTSENAYNWSHTKLRQNSKVANVSSSDSSSRMTKPLPINPHVRAVTVHSEGNTNVQDVFQNNYDALSAATDVSPARSGLRLENESIHSDDISVPVCTPNDDVSHRGKSHRQSILTYLNSARADPPVFVFIDASAKFRLMLASKNSYPQDDGSCFMSWNDMSVFELPSPPETLGPLNVVILWIKSAETEFNQLVGDGIVDCRSALDYAMDRPEQVLLAKSVDDSELVSARLSAEGPDQQSIIGKAAVFNILTQDDVLYGVSTLDLSVSCLRVLDAALQLSVMARGRSSSDITTASGASKGHSENLFLTGDERVVAWFDYYRRTQSEYMNLVCLSIDNVWRTMATCQSLREKGCLSHPCGIRRLIAAASSDEQRVPLPLPMSSIRFGIPTNSNNKGVSTSGEMKSSMSSSKHHHHHHHHLGQRASSSIDNTDDIITTSSNNNNQMMMMMPPTTSECCSVNNNHINNVSYQRIHSSSSTPVSRHVISNSVYQNSTDNNCTTTGQQPITTNSPNIASSRLASEGSLPSTPTWGAGKPPHLSLMETLGLKDRNQVQPYNNSRKAIVPPVPGGGGTITTCTSKLNLEQRNLLCILQSELSHGLDLLESTSRCLRDFKSSTSDTTRQDTLNAISATKKRWTVLLSTICNSPDHAPQQQQQSPKSNNSITSANYARHSNPKISPESGEPSTKRHAWEDPNLQPNPSGNTQSTASNPDAQMNPHEHSRTPNGAPPPPGGGGYTFPQLISQINQLIQGGSSHRGSDESDQATGVGTGSTVETRPAPVIEVENMNRSGLSFKDESPNHFRRKRATHLVRNK